ncbi:MAG: penicillin-binding protein activator [Desulfurococcales archaeon]|nr:penicillin-binding protein activator [Desulfurococcales archaeon]
MNRLATLGLVLLLLAAPLFGAISSMAQPTTITVGSLLPLTGDLQSYGERAKAAVEVAVEDMNKFLEEQNAWFRLKLVVEDTQTKPDVAVQKFNSLIAQNIKLIVGPMTSAEVKKLKDLADQNNVLLISPSSTAIELAIPGDNVFRFCPADDIQSKAIGALARDLGIKAVVVVNRADTWGEGLKDATIDVLKANGIEVKNVYSYNPESPGFTAIASSVNNDVEALLKEYNPAQVAVVAIGFNEIVQLFKEAAKYPTLAKVPWLGSDGTAVLSEFTEDPVAARFGTNVLFINPIFSPAASAVQDDLKKKVEAKIGQEPDAYAMAAHDAIVAITLALLQTGPIEDPDEMVNRIKQLLPEITLSDDFAKFAATGKFPLNDAGDRGTADYDWFILYMEGGKAKWVKAGVYKGIEDRNEFYKLPDGKTYLDIYSEKFGVEVKPTQPPPQTQTQTVTQTVTQTQTAPGEAKTVTVTQTVKETVTVTQTETVTETAGGGNTLTIALAILVVILAVALALRMR